MIETKQIAVTTSRGSATVNVVQIPAMRSGKLLVRLVGTLGPPLGSIAVAGSQDKPEAFGAAIATLGEKLTPAEFASIAGELLGPCTVNVEGNGEVPLQPLIDDLFTGHVAELFKVLGFTLKVNYADFFGEGALGKLIKAGAKMGIKIPTENATQTRSSGQPNG